MLFGANEEEKNRVGEFVSSVLNVAWVPEKFAAVGWEIDGKITAGVIYENYSGRNVFMHIASIGNYWSTKTFLYYVFSYPFNQLRVNRLTAVVESTNEKCCKFCEHLGYKEETRLKDAGATGDLIFYTMLKDECQWIINDENRKEVLA